MASDDVFEPQLGRMRAQAPKPPKSHRARVLHAVQRSGGFKRAPSSPRQMSGRYGRGAGVARLLKGGPSKGARARRVVVKARFTRLAGKGLQAAAAHLHYLQRDGVTRDGEKGMLYSPDADRIDASDFMARCQDDRHQFRFIVAPEDSPQYDDLKPLIRKTMSQMETDLGTTLDWVAVDHFNTGHPHTHIVVRGRDEQGKDLVIARDYLGHGLRNRLEAQVSLDLGPRSDREIVAGLQAQIGQERLTGIDRQLRREAVDDGRVMAGHSDPVLSAVRTGRLVKLEQLGLAQSLSNGAWQLHPDMEPTLKAMAERGDIIKTMHRAMREKGIDADPADGRVHAGPTLAEGLRRGVTGRLIERGMADDFGARHYLILDGADGRAHYLDIGQGDLTDTLPHQAILRITPKVAAIRSADQTIAEVAARSGGYYSVDLHLKADPMARQAFAETHVRRLEAIRKTDGSLTREPDGRFRIGSDYLVKALAYEERQVRRRPVTIDVLSDLPLAAQTRHPGVTWLDQELTGSGPLEPYATRGFGGEVQAALRARQMWLIEEGLIPEAGPLPSTLLTTLHRRELRAVARELEGETGKAWRDVRNGEQIEGRLRQSVALGSGRFAVVERARDFALVPWRPVLEKHIGKDVSGLVRDEGINWTIGRGQGRDLE